jgi:hypothetical protein
MASGILLIVGLASRMGALLAALLSLHVQFSEASGPCVYECGRVGAAPGVHWVGASLGVHGMIARDHPRWRRVFD